MAERRPDAARGAASMLEVVEWELQQVQLDLHDGPVQHMYAALSQLDLLRLALEAPTGIREARDRLDRVRRLIETALQDIRQFIGAYRAPEFETQGLPALLEGLALQHEDLTDTRVELACPAGLPPVDLPVKIALYRVLQEALSNAYRHGGASSVTVEVREADGRIRVVVRDNGAGFEPCRPPPRGHFGLSGMRDRVEMVGGTFQLESAPGEGTTVTVEVPR